MFKKVHNGSSTSPKFVDETVSNIAMLLSCSSLIVHSNVILLTISSTNFDDIDEPL
jgi:hypothetical protein